VLPGLTVGLQLPDHMAAWIAELKAKGYAIEGRRDVFKPVTDYPGSKRRGHSFAPPIFSAADSETAFIADAMLKWLSVRRDRNWFLHGVFLRPHPPLIAPEPYNAMYDPALVPLPIPDTVPEMLAQLRARTDQIRSFIDKGSFASIYVPAFQAKDLALALDARKQELPPDRRRIAEPAIARLVRSAWLLDAFGDIGNKQQITEAYAKFVEAANDIQAAFPSQP